ncbi:MAG: FAD-binding protein, partial [Comamonas sp.]|nr:FAD-binding protein [Comamonas sp.]
MSYSKANITKRKFDVVIVGAGGSGLRAALELSRAGLSVASLSKVFPTRSHTVAAQGGVSASLGNMSEDNWHYHFYDTIKGSDWLGDQDAIEFMCREAPNVVIELEHFGMPFDRNADGTIYQRPFGGHTANYGEKPVQRACAAADRTGHAMLHTLYQQNVKSKTNFFVEWMALDLIRNTQGDVVGVTALELETGDLYELHAKAVLLATAKGQWIDSIAASPASGLIAFSAGRTLSVIDVKDVAFRRDFQHERTVSGVAFDPKGRRIATATYGGAALW